MKKWNYLLISFSSLEKTLFVKRTLLFAYTYQRHSIYEWATKIALKKIRIKQKKIFKNVFEYLWVK